MSGSNVFKGRSGNRLVRWLLAELRQERIEVDEKAKRFIDEAAKRGEIHLVARRRQGTE